MTPRENLLKTLKRKGFQTVPADIVLCPSQVETFEKRYGHQDYPSHFKLPYRRIEVPLKAEYKNGRDLFKREELPANTEIDAWGVGRAKCADACVHLTRMHSPLKGDVSVEEVREYLLPSIAPGAKETLGGQVKNIHLQGLASMGGCTCTIWEIAWAIRSMEDLMVDMMTEDEKASIHLDKITELAVQRVRLLAEVGVDILRLGDDIGMQRTIMMSEELWRTWLKPRLARVIKAARDAKPDILIFYHSCGYIQPFLEELREVGVDILNPVQPECMDFNEVVDLTGEYFSYWGTIGTQTTLPHGTPKDVQETVWSRLKKCGERGGIVIGPTHVVEPEVPWENIEAMFEAVREFAF